MQVKIKIEAIEVWTDGDYCNSCPFRRYINREIGHVCLLFREAGIKRDGNNFIRPNVCKEAEKNKE